MPPDAPRERCYQARAKSTFVKVHLDEEDPERAVTAVVASVEPDCADAGPARMGSDWGGCRGIRLYDPAEKLRSVDAIPRAAGERGYPWDGSPPGVSRFDYRCEPEKTCGVMASAFVRAGTIIAVSIWSPDC
jgi:hypothetical protein